MWNTKHRPKKKTHFKKNLDVNEKKYLFVKSSKFIRTALTAFVKFIY